MGVHMFYLEIHIFGLDIHMLAFCPNKIVQSFFIISSFLEVITLRFGRWGEGRRANGVFHVPRTQIRKRTIAVGGPPTPRGCMCAYVNIHFQILGSCLFGQGETPIGWVSVSQVICLRGMRARVQLGEDEYFR